MLSKIRNKKAALETKEILELILAAAGIFILIVLLYQLLAPSFNKDKETAKSYFNSFKTVIGEVDKSGFGQFSLWAGETKMVYFGSHKQSIRFEGGVFLRSNTKKNYLCFCYGKGKNWKCDYCTSLKYRAEFSKLWNNVPVYEQGWKFEINLDKDANLYLFNATKTG